MAGQAAISVYVRRRSGAAGLDAVAAHAAAHRLGVIAESPARHCIVLRGAPAALAGAFHPVPASLQTAVEAVLGPDDPSEAVPAADAPRPAVRLQDAPGESAAALAAPLAMAAGDGAGHCVGVVSCGGTVHRAALDAACAALGLAPPAQRLHLVAVDAAPPATEPAGGPLLPMLLLLGALAPRARVVVYAAPATARGWTDAVSAAIHDQDNRPSVVCTGWLPPPGATLAGRLAAEAEAIGVRLFLPDADHDPGALAAPEPGRSYAGGAIDAALHAAARLRVAAAPAAAAAAPAEGEDAPPPTPRPHFDAITEAPRPHAAAHRAAVAFETDRFPGPAAEHPLPVRWRLLPGSAARALAAGGDGSLWALSGLPVQGGFALFRWTGCGWAPAFAGGVALAADAEGRPWIVDAFGTLLRFTGTDWRPERGDLHDVAIAPSGAVWALSRQAGPQGRTLLHRPAGSGAAWTETDAKAERVAVAADGAAWIVSKAGEAWRRDGDDWVREARNVRDLAFGPRGEVWAVSRRGRRLYRRDRPEDGWRRAEGIAERLAVTADGALWAITPLGQVAVGVALDPPAATECDGMAARNGAAESGPAA